MRKLWFMVIAAAAVLLAACAPAKPAGNAAKAVATEDPKLPKMACQVVSMTPTQGPTEVSMFPPPQKDDWVLGKNASAPLTITEYSDFQ